MIKLIQKGTRFLCLCIIVFTITFISCEKGEDVTKISSHASNESHKVGSDCMSCHKSGGEGDGWFTVAGTVYKSTASDEFSLFTINFYSDTSEKSVALLKVQVDKKGNFYTTEDIDFNDGLYVALANDEQERFKNHKITFGKCNSCHGSTTDQIKLY